MNEFPFEWNVYRYNINTRKVEVYNVFLHYGFLVGIAKWIKKYKDDEEKLKEEIRHELFYYYWSKYEWEVIISPFSSNKEGEIKTDVYEQIMMNWDKFITYTLEHKKDILKYVKKLER